jgi:hypothetical protein
MSSSRILLRSTATARKRHPEIDPAMPMAMVRYRTWPAGATGSSARLDAERAWTNTG